MRHLEALTRAQDFAARHGLRLPVLLSPMAGACPVALSATVARAGGLGACGALLMSPGEIGKWAEDFRAASNGGFQINLWLPSPPPVRDAAGEATQRAFLAGFGPSVPQEAGDTTPPDFATQFDALLDARPAVASSMMGLFAPDDVARLRQAGIAWFATVTTVAEARAAEAAGADALIVQGAEAGGHRGAFAPEHAERTAVGLFSLLPAVADAVRLPLIAAGGIADGRTIAAALLLGAAAVQIGTGLLRTPEASIAPAWANALATAAPEDTLLTRAFSGKAGRGLATPYTLAANAPPPAPYPVQRGLTAAMRAQAVRENNLSAMQAWAGQSAALARAEPAAALVQRWWDDAVGLL